MRMARGAMLPAGILCAMAGHAACQGIETASSITDVEFREVVSVGMIDGDERELFGQIVDVRAAGDGSFFVIDRTGGTLGRFDPSGTYLGGIRNRGQGPGELLEPVAGAVTSPGSLVVIDPPNGRYSFYRFDGGGLRPERSVRSMLSDGTSACSIGGRLFIHGHHEGLLVHELSASGGIARSFGDASPVSSAEFGSATPMVAAQRNRGRLLCLEEEGMVVSVSTYLPLVRAYNVDGVPMWEAALANWRPLGFRPVENRGVQFEVPQGGYHMGVSVTRWGTRSIVVQYAVSEGPHLESRELSLRTGEEMARTDELPLLADVYQGRFYSFENDPFPRAMILVPGERR